MSVGGGAWDKGGGGLGGGGCYSVSCLFFDLYMVWTFSCLYNYQCMGLGTFAVSYQSPEGVRGGNCFREICFSACHCTGDSSKYTLSR